MDKTQEAIANLLWEARKTGIPCPPITETYPHLSIQESYSISEINAKKRSAEPNVRFVGKKIGLTSLAVQKQLGVDQPDFGYLSSDMKMHSGGRLPSQALIQGRVEGEVAFILHKSLCGPGVTKEDVEKSTAYVLPCIEIIDSRIENWNIKIQDTIADNASSAFFVLGEEKKSLDTINLLEEKMDLYKNKTLSSTGIGSNCLGDPAQAVAWLANCMGSLGVTLEAGDIILSGAYGPVVPVVHGDYCEIIFSSLGSVSVHI